MKNLPPLTEKIARGVEGGHELERLMNARLFNHADRPAPPGSTGCGGTHRSIRATMPRAPSVAD